MSHIELKARDPLAEARKAEAIALARLFAEAQRVETNALVYMIVALAALLLSIALVGWAVLA